MHVTTPLPTEENDLEEKTRDHEMMESLANAQDEEEFFRIVEKRLAKATTEAARRRSTFLAGRFFLFNGMPELGQKILFASFGTLLEHPELLPPLAEHSLNEGNPKKCVQLCELWLASVPADSAAMEDRIRAHLLCLANGEKDGDGDLRMHFHRLCLKRLGVPVAMLPPELRGENAPMMFPSVMRTETGEWIKNS